MALLPADARSYPPGCEASAIEIGRSVQLIALESVSHLESLLSRLTKVEEDIVNWAVDDGRTSGKRHWELLARLRVAAECIHGASLLGVPARQAVAATPTDSQEGNAAVHAPQRCLPASQTSWTPMTPQVRARPTIAGRQRSSPPLLAIKTSTRGSGRANQSFPFPAAGRETANTICSSPQVVEELQPCQTTPRTTCSTIRVRERAPVPVHVTGAALVGAHVGPPERFQTGSFRVPAVSANGSPGLQACRISEPALAVGRESGLILTALQRPALQGREAPVQDMRRLPQWQMQLVTASNERVPLMRGCASTPGLPARSAAISVARQRS